MSYVVNEEFIERFDDDYHYQSGDVYPRTGFIPPDRRCEELSTVRNRYGRIFITEAVDEVTEPDDGQESQESEEVEKEKVTRYATEDLNTMTISEIKALAVKLGYSVTQTKKNDIIVEFLEQQG